jgi:CHAD domain-containing protein
LRIAYKRLRYTVETFANALPADLAALAPTAARFQKWLGDLHDVHVAIASVRRARKLTEESRAELLAILDRLRVERVAAYAREVGIALVPSLPQAEGTVALRKISSR